MRQAVHALLSFLVLQAIPTPGSQPVGRFFALDSNMVRGAAPGSLEEFLFLRDLGIRTIISFDTHKPKFDLADSLGMRYVHIPIGYGSVPREKELDFLAAIRNPLTPGPYYIHCHGGKYRVGAMAAVYRMQESDWSRDSAFQEMMRLNGKTEYPGLKSTVLGYKTLPEKAIAGHGFDPMARPHSSDLAEQMMDINKAFRRIKKYAAMGMEADEMAGLALGLEELYYEIHRLKLCPACDSAGYALFQKAAQAIQRRRLRRDFGGDWVRELQSDCRACHNAYRR